MATTFDDIQRRYAPDALMMRIVRERLPDFTQAARALFEGPPGRSTLIEWASWLLEAALPRTGRRNRLPNALLADVMWPSVRPGSIDVSGVVWLSRGPPDPAGAPHPLALLDVPGLIHVYSRGRTVLASDLRYWLTLVHDEIRREIALPSTTTEARRLLTLIDVPIMLDVLGI